MEQKMVKGMKRQLNALADVIGKAGEEQDLILMLQTGAFLLSGCAKVGGNVFASMQEGAFGDAMDAFAMMAKHASEIMNNPRCAGQMALADALGQLRRAGEAAGLRGAALHQEIKNQRRKNEEMEAINRSMKAELKELNAARCDLLCEGDEIMERRAAVQQEMNRLQAQWSEIDAETQQHVRETEALEQTLERLRANPSDFSPERQAQLRVYIDQLKEDIAREREAAEQLQQAIQQLQQEKYRDLCRRGQMESDVLSDITGILSDLESIGVDLGGKLEAAKRTADTLSQRFEECRRMQADYESWLDADGAALDELARLLGENDPLNSALRETLDPAATQEMRRLRQSAEESLRRMDELLTPCIRAMGEGRRAVLNKVSQGPGGERA